jgi:hypothetical protein
MTIDQIKCVTVQHCTIYTLSVCLVQIFWTCTKARIRTKGKNWKPWYKESTNFGSTNSNLLGYPISQILFQKFPTIYPSATGYTLNEPFFPSYLMLDASRLLTFSLHLPTLHVHQARVWAGLVPPKPVGTTALLASHCVAMSHPPPHLFFIGLPASPYTHPGRHPPPSSLESTKICCHVHFSVVILHWVPIPCHVPSALH